MSKNNIARSIHALFGVILLVILYTLFRLTDNQSIRVAAGISFLFFVAISYGVRRALVYDPDGIFKEFD